MKYTSIGYVSIDGVDITDHVSDIRFDYRREEKELRWAEARNAMEEGITVAFQVHDWQFWFPYFYGMTYEEFLNMYYSPSSVHETGWLK